MAHVSGVWDQHQRTDRRRGTAVPDLKSRPQWLRARASRQVRVAFEQMWEGTRAYKGEKFQGGPADILEAKVLMGFGSMLNTRKLARVLKTNGWSAGAVVALLSAMGAEAAVSAPQAGGGQS
jgi:hypothetical protein